MDESTPRQMYFDDVELQMDAKLWGEEYSRHNPPKKGTSSGAHLPREYQPRHRCRHGLVSFMFGSFLHYI